MTVWGWGYWLKHQLWGNTVGKTLIHKIRETTLCIFIILKSIQEGNQIKEDLFLLNKILEFVANQGPLKTVIGWKVQLEQLLSFFFSFFICFTKHIHFEPLKQITSKRYWRNLFSFITNSFYRKDSFNYFFKVDLVLNILRV